MRPRCLAGVSVFFAVGLFLARPFAACGATAGSGPTSVEEASSPTFEVQRTSNGGGCSRASLAVLNDIVGSVSEDPFQPNPSIGGEGVGTNPAGCGRPNFTRKQDPGNPVTPVGRPTSSFTITGTFP